MAFQKINNSRMDPDRLASAQGQRGEADTYGNFHQPAASPPASRYNSNSLPPQPTIPPSSYSGFPQQTYDQGGYSQEPQSDYSQQQSYNQQQQSGNSQSRSNSQQKLPVGYDQSQAERSFYNQQQPAQSNYSQQPVQSNYSQQPDQSNYNKQSAQSNNYSQQPAQSNYSQQPAQSNYSQQPMQPNYSQQPAQSNNYINSSQVMINLISKHRVFRVFKMVYSRCR
eukprot:597476_1